MIDRSLLTQLFINPPLMLMASCGTGYGIFGKGAGPVEMDSGAATP
jgi:hypothetical protein